MQDGEVAPSSKRARESDELFISQYEELRIIARAAMRRQSPAHTLQPTALVNEAFVKLVRRRGGWKDRSHFLTAAARAMRCLLVDHARTRSRRKRRASARRLDFDTAFLVDAEREIDIVDLDEALERLARYDERASRIVELRFFGGLSPDDVSSVLRIPLRTVERDWQWARIWLHAELT